MSVRLFFVLSIVTLAADPANAANYLFSGTLSNNIIVTGSVMVDESDPGYAAGGTVEFNNGGITAFRFDATNGPITESIDSQLIANPNPQTMQLTFSASSFPAVESWDFSLSNEDSPLFQFVTVFSGQDFDQWVGDQLIGSASPSTGQWSLARVGINGAPCAYAMVSEAMQAATSGNTIYVTVGAYNERLGFTRDNLSFSAAAPGTDCTQLEPYPGGRATIDATGISFNGVGGMLHVADGASVNLFQIDLTNGLTGQGGLVFLDTGTTLTTFGSSFSNGTASADLLNPMSPAAINEPAGGCVYAQGATLDMQESSLSGCRVVGPGGGAASGDGGAIHARDASNISVGFLANMSTNSARDGGAVAAFGSTLTLEQISFSTNTADREGGALLLQDSTTQLNFSVAFDANTAGRNGGALAVVGGSLLGNGFHLFSDNFAVSDGGAVYAVSTDIALGPGTTDTEVAFENNQAEFGGALAGFNSGPDVLMGPTVSGGRFEGNVSGNLGGALALVGGNWELLDTRIIGNQAAQGGGAYLQTATFMMDSSSSCKANQFADPDQYCSSIQNNNATPGGALIVRDGSTAVLNRTAIINNRPSVVINAAKGGPVANAIYLLSDINGANELEMENVWLYGNSGNTVRGESGALITIGNSTFDNNENTAIDLFGTSRLDVARSILYSNGAGVMVNDVGVTVTNSCNIDQSGVVGPNINPVLTETSDGLSHLGDGSPAIDACGQTITSDFDLEGAPRILGTAVDMGPFEYTTLFKNGFED